MDKDKKPTLDFLDTDDYDVGAFGTNDFGCYGFDGSQSQTQDFLTQSQFTQPHNDFTQDYASQSQIDPGDDSSSSSSVSCNSTLGFLLDEPHEICVSGR